ncbi:cytochrome-c peroxidase [Nautilia sp.]
MKKFFIFIFIVFVKAGYFTPIPLKNDANMLIAEIGKRIFFDPFVSKSGKIGCYTCHIPKNYYTNHIATPTGVDGYVFKRNTPTLLNIRYNYYFEWDGKYKTLRKCVKEALENRHETDITPERIAQKLKNTEYEKLFKKAFKNGLNGQNVLTALSEYIKTLTTPGSKFDRFLRGEGSLSEEELKGYELFVKKGCVACHNGVLLGGNLITKFGFMKERKTDDLGRYYVTKNPKDKYYFKVPTLRNITETYPYMHDGSVKTLKEAVEIMLKFQLEKIYTERDVELIIEFLKTLKGDLPDDKKN